MSKIVLHDEITIVSIDDKSRRSALIHHLETLGVRAWEKGNNIVTDNQHAEEYLTILRKSVWATNRAMDVFGGSVRSWLTNELE